MNASRCVAGRWLQERRRPQVRWALSSAVREAMQENNSNLEQRENDPLGGSAGGGRSSARAAPPLLFFDECFGSSIASCELLAHTARCSAPVCIACHNTEVECSEAPQNPTLWSSCWRTRLCRCASYHCTALAAANCALQPSRCCAVQLCIAYSRLSVCACRRLHVQANVPAASATPAAALWPETGGLGRCKQIARNVASRDAPPAVRFRRAPLRAPLLCLCSRRRTACDAACRP